MDIDGNESILETYLYETNTLLEQLDSIGLAAEQADTLSENDVNEVFKFHLIRTHLILSHICASVIDIISQHT